MFGCCANRTVEVQSMTQGDNQSAFGRGVRKGLQVAALAAALVPLGSVPATAAPGTVRQVVGVPFLGCDGPEGSGTGTALTTVPGGKAGFPTTRVLLVNSCVSTNSETQSQQIRVFFTDPNGEGASVRKILVTTFPANATAASKPTSGWQALALRADKGDLIACGTNGNSTVLWSIDFSPFNSAPDGTATFLRNGPAGSSCGAIAWDPSDGSVYQTAAPGFNVLHNKDDGTALASVAVPTAACNTSITGLGIAGTSLFVACAGTGGEISQPPKIAQLYKVNGSLQRQFTDDSCDGSCSGGLIFRGVPDDPATLAFEFNELIWALTDNGTYVGFEMAGGTLGQKSGVPALNPGSCPGGNISSDGDGLLDCWKNRTLWSDGKPGINYAGVYAAGSSPTTRDVTLCVNESLPSFNLDNDCAKPGRPDLFLEIDYMNFHKPETAAGSAVANVIAMFQNAPNSNNRYPTPYTGIALHVQIDELISVNGVNHFNNVAFPPCTAPAAANDSTTVDFDAVKRSFFGTAAERTSLGTKPNALNAKGLVYRYALMAHNLLGLGTTSGCAEILGNDLIVSLGSWGTQTFGTGKSATTHGVGTVDQLGGTLAHEFGHTLGQRHGGGDNINCKANYPSVMNYNHQFFNPTTRLLDYSRQALLQLDKTNLNEADGVGPGYAGKVGFGPVAPLSSTKTATAGGPIDWNANGSSGDVGLNLDLPQTTSGTGGCPANQKGAPGNDQGQFLVSFDDWANIQFSFRGSVDFADGAHVTSGETTLTTDHDGVPLGATPDITLETAASFTGNAIPVLFGVKKNNLNAGSNETIEVDIYTGAVDAATLVPLSIHLQGLPPATWSVAVRTTGQGDPDCNVRDVNHDNRPDLVCKFDIPKNTVDPSEAMVLLTGVSIDATHPEGQPVGGTAPISVQP
jgi:hypothetical protein